MIGGSANKAPGWPRNAARAHRGARPSASSSSGQQEEAAQNPTSSRAARQQPALLPAVQGAAQVIWQAPQGLGAPPPREVESREKYSLPWPVQRTTLTSKLITSAWPRIAAWRPTSSGGKASAQGVPPRLTFSARPLLLLTPAAMLGCPRARKAPVARHLHDRAYKQAPAAPIKYRVAALHDGGLPRDGSELSAPCRSMNAALWQQAG